jgi:cystathionine gamma-lyase
MKSDRYMKFETKVIHAGVEPDPLTGSVMTPIYQTSTYKQDAPGVHKGYEYARTQNPTREALEKNLAALENGYGGVSFASGLAAMDAILKTLESGDEVVSINDLYGGSYRLIKAIFEKLGIKSKFIDMSRPENLRNAISPSTKLIWVETPTNPMLQIVDIEAICKVAKEKGIKVCVDNTFATPFLQTPLDLGADMVLHSATKYLGGHSDVIHGAVICKDAEDYEKIKFVQNASGAVPGPMDCFLILRGIKTLHLRVQRACENAAAIAEFLQKHPKVEKVCYPGIKSHPGHDIAKKQMKDFGGMVSFDLGDNNEEAAMKVLSATKYFLLAESLGGVESLIGHPASMTHGSIPRVERLKTGLTDSLIRLSVGVESVDDLIEDLENSLSTI